MAMRGTQRQKTPKAGAKDSQVGLQGHRRPSVPLYLEVADLIRRQILEGKLAPGEQLATLATLTEELHISRVTARLAMNVLESEGLIERTSGRGTFVRPRDKLPYLTLHLEADLPSVFTMVEGELTSLMIKKAQLVDALPGSPESRGPFHRMKRVHSIEKRPYSIIEVFLRDDVYEVAPERFMRDLAAQVLRDLGVPIASVHQTLRLSSADLEEAELLRVPVNSPIFKVYRKFIDHDGQVFLAADIVYRGDFIVLDIEFKDHSGVPKKVVRSQR